MCKTLGIHLFGKAEAELLQLKLPLFLMANLFDITAANPQSIQKGKRTLPKSQKAIYQTLLSIVEAKNFNRGSFFRTTKLKTEIVLLNYFL